MAFNVRHLLQQMHLYWHALVISTRLIKWVNYNTANTFLLVYVSSKTWKSFADQIPDKMCILCRVLTKQHRFLSSIPVSLCICPWAFVSIPSWTCFCRDKERQGVGCGWLTKPGQGGICLMFIPVAFSCREPSYGGCTLIHVYSTWPLHKALGKKQPTV